MKNMLFFGKKCPDNGVYPGDKTLKYKKEDLAGRALGLLLAAPQVSE